MDATLLSKCRFVSIRVDSSSWAKSRSWSNSVTITRMKESGKGLYVIMISPHGLIRGGDLELGRDADTGGQTKYVVELARALGHNPEVSRVDLMTRLISDPDISPDYSEPFEELSENVQIVRIECGESGYLPKEELWDSLESFADNALNYIYDLSEKPDIVHSHYADAGHVGIQISNLLGVPLIFTGHSLGRTKRKRLIANGISHETIETTYNIRRRIEAEEKTLGTASKVIVSTNQEIEEQYALYDYYQPEQMFVVPPGTDLDQFYPPEGDEADTPIARELARFLTEPEKPIVLAISRPDPRKNIRALIKAFGQSEKLQRLANLVIVAGNREDILEMPRGSRDVLNNILLAIDEYDLYGRVAYPKHHESGDVSLLYRLAVLSKGVFVNPALTEPFGLTLIEAAATGLPVVATEDGGPIDIIGNCENGLLVDPLDSDAIAAALIEVIENRSKWEEFAVNGVKGVKRHYSWPAHVDKYLAEIRPLIEATKPFKRIELSRRPVIYRDAAVITDLDFNLLGDPESLSELTALLRRHRRYVSFGIVTGHSLKSALSVLRKHKISQPDILIPSLGTEIYYAPGLTEDVAWRRHINHRWNRSDIRKLFADTPGLELQPPHLQTPFKLSYFIDPDLAPDLEEINRLLLQDEQSVNVFYSRGQYLDFVPYRASKGYALRWAAKQLDLPLENLLVAGGSGADEDMMRGNTKAVVVANRHDEELSGLVDIDQIYFSEESFAAGIIEAIDHYKFFEGQNKASA